MKKPLFLAILAAAVSSLTGAEPSAILTLDKTIPLADVDGRIDHLAVDIPGARLFVAALGNNTVEVLDLKEGKRLQSLQGFSEPQGLVYVPELDRIFIANGGDGSCRILDGHSFELLGNATLGRDADNVRYDARRKRVFVGYGTGGLAALDPQTGAKLAEISLPGHPESFRLEQAGDRIFVNVPSAKEMVVADRTSGRISAKWPLSEASANFPLALDEANHRILAGCRDPAKLLIYDEGGRLAGSVSISGDTDDLFYDPENKLIYISCGQGSIDIVRQKSADEYVKIDSLPEPAGSRTSLFVPELKVFCLAVPHRGTQPAEIRVFKVK